MIDDSDGDYVLLASGGSILLIILSIVIYFIAYQNEDECSKRKCREGSVAKVIDHECLCVEQAK
jgi:hypothetical protein